MRNKVTRKKKHVRIDGDTMFFSLGVFMLGLVCSPYEGVKMFIFAFALTLVCVYFPAWEFSIGERTTVEFEDEEGE